jgi:hypothetical protein
VSLNDLGLLLRNNYILAVKDRMDFPVQQWSLTDPLCFHGHVWIEGDWKRLEEKIDKNTKFEFISKLLL